MTSWADQNAALRRDRDAMDAVKKREAYLRSRDEVAPVRPTQAPAAAVLSIIGAAKG